MRRRTVMDAVSWTVLDDVDWTRSAVSSQIHLPLNSMSMIKKLGLPRVKITLIIWNIAMENSTRSE